MQSTKKEIRPTYFPLATNVEWFRDAERKASLEARIKQCFLLHDVLAFEAGTLHIRVVEGEHGGIFPLKCPWDESSGDFDYMEQTLEGEQFTTGFLLPSNRVVAVAGGTLARNYTADFYKTLQDIHEEIGEHDAVKIFPHWKLPADKEHVKQQMIWRDEKIPLIQEYLEERSAGRWLRQLLLRTVNEAILLSQGDTVVLSPELSRILEGKIHEIQADTNLATFGVFLDLEVPNFASCGWKDLAKLRKDRALRDFRRLIRSLATRVQPDRLFREPEQVRDEVRRAYSDQLHKALDDLAPSGQGMCMEAFLGGLGELIPGLGIFTSTINTVRNYRQRRRWHRFVSRLKKASSR